MVLLPISQRFTSAPALQSLIKSTFSLGQQCRNYDRKRYLKEKKKAKLDLTKLSDVFKTLRTYSFHGSASTTADNDAPTPIPYHVQFQLRVDVLSKPLTLSTVLPHRVSAAGDQRILLFSGSEEGIKRGKELGATICGGEELFEKVMDGSLEFDACVSTRDIFPKIIKLARYLGPKGLMPSPAKQTVSDSVDELMSKLSASTPLKSDPEEWTISSIVGMSNWSDEALEANLIAMHKAIADGKPSKVDVSKLVENIVIYGRHTPGFILPKRPFKM